MDGYGGDGGGGGGGGAGCGAGRGWRRAGRLGTGEILTALCLDVVLRLTAVLVVLVFGETKACSVAIQLEVEAVEALGLTAVHLVHPLADPRLLVEHCAIQT